MSREERGKRTNELGREYTQTHDERVKSELSDLSHKLVEDTKSDYPCPRSFAACSALCRPQTLT
jgi:hypothetical protein